MLDTRPSLLFRIRDAGDSAAWSEFVTIYAPLLHAYAMKNGLQDADAADLAQESLRLVLRAAPEFVYDPARGSFRGWLFTLTRNALRKFTTRGREIRGTGDSAMRAVLEDHPTPEPDAAEWDREYQMNLFHWAAQRVQPEFRETTWQAFWRTVVQGEAIDGAAAALNLTAGAVYIARSRVTARIRQEISTIEGD